MSAAKHTSGPWSAMPSIGPGDWAILSEQVNAGGNFHVATLPNCPHAEAEANARLIAASPDGHALLEFIREHIESKANCVPLHALFGDDNTSFQQAVLAYFAKATGGAS